MKVLGWAFRIIAIALGVSLFFLQSQFAKKSVLESIINHPLRNSPLTVEVEGIRGLFPFQFTVASLAVKNHDRNLTSLSDIFVVWSLPALINLDVKLCLEKGKELAGDIVYAIDKHALQLILEGKGLPLRGKDVLLQSIFIDFPTLDLLKGQVVTKVHDGENVINVALQLEELDEERLKIQDIRLIGKGLKSKGSVTVYPKKGTWEGKAELSITDLKLYERWVPKELAGSATLKGEKALTDQANVDIHLEQFQYGTFEAKALDAKAHFAEKGHIRLTVQGQETQLNDVSLQVLSISGDIVGKRGSFDIIGIGPKNISFHANGFVALPTSHTSQTQITIAQAELKHPMHQFFLKSPASFAWDQKSLQSPKVWLATGDGTMAIQDLIIGDALSGTFSINQLPLTLLRMIDPKWSASGHLSGKGTLKGTSDDPNITLSLKGKSLQWEKPKKPSKPISNPLRVDLSTTLALFQGILSWKAELTRDRLFTLASQGKFFIGKGYSTPNNTFEATLKGRGDLSIISFFTSYGDLIQGQASLDLTGRGTIQNPVIKGDISITNGLYENATFGTLVKNITVHAKASEDRLTLSSFTGKDNANGLIKGHGSIQFASLLNPTIDLNLLFDQFIIAHNDEIFAKTKGTLKFQGPLKGDVSTKAKITGDMIIQPLEIRLNEHAEKIVSIKLVEKKTGQFYQKGVKPLKLNRASKSPPLFPIDIKLASPGEIYLWGYGIEARWKGVMNIIGTLADPYVTGEISLVQGKYKLLEKPFKLSEGRITFSQSHKNDPLLLIVGKRDVGKITAILRAEGYASDPRVTFSSTPALPQEEVLARALFGKGIENISITQSLLLANALSTLKGGNKLNFTDKIRSAFGLDTLEFKERKPLVRDDFQSPTQQVSVGKQISDKVYFSLDQSVTGAEDTNATVQFDVTPSLKIEADIGGAKNTGVGFAWVKKY